MLIKSENNEIRIIRSCEITLNYLIKNNEFPLPRDNPLSIPI